ncbi:ThuA domain-containing protein [Maribacter sp. 2308TA10-17]|uniref:ThuA domain-containing protein n=1 Tax=Maribacter sp. 2308TA10-17 TaxID=3386276 RepID=UPI0039BD3106
MPLLFMLLLSTNLWSQNLELVEIDQVWLSKIEKLAPEKTSVKTTKIRKLLIFSKATGFYHWTIPHNIEMLKILAKKTGAFEVHVGFDIAQFNKKNLKKYDAVILNNPNPAGPERDLFSDLLMANTSFSEQQVKTEAAIYEKNLINYVSKGGGLMIIHGGIVVQNNSMEFSKMTGGSFDYHTKQQEINVKEVDVNHPMVKAFNGKGFTHVDEPYFFKNAYLNYNFRPLLYVEVDKVEGMKEAVDEKIIYVSWIKRHDKGRVFFSSPSHNAQSMENTELLQFFLDGMQYVVGDLKCDDSPIGKN